MASLIDQILSSQGDQIGRQISNQFGVPKEKTADLLSQVGPLVLGGLKKQAQEGDTGLLSGLLGSVLGGSPGPAQGQGQDGGSGGFSLPGTLGSLFGEPTGTSAESPVAESLPGAGAPSPLAAEGLLGSVAPRVADLISQHLGVSPDKSREIMAVIVGAVTQYLTKEGGGTVGLTAMLDKDGDGSVLDDLGDLLGGFLGGKR